MSNFDHLELDGHALRLFLAVLEEGSVTAAAERLGVTQSAVSHNLTKLRRIMRDPLFTKSGRGIVATAHAQNLAEQARFLLDQMQAFASGADFNPHDARMSLTIAANDLQRDLLLPSLFTSLERQLADTRMTVVPSLLPGPALLRENRCDLLISPRPPEGVDIVQKRLLTDHYMVFYDPGMRDTPASSDAYLSARHITVRYGNNRTLEFDDMLENQGIIRNIVLRVPNFTAIAEFLRGSQMIATLPSLLQQHALRDFARAPMPLDTLAPGTIDLPIFMCWHQRYQHDPSHRWLRDQLEDVVAAKLRTPSNQPLSQQTS
ncbi:MULTISPECIES: LysR family transcriptional regulator [Thalassospira]|uniref:Transcriptional regulator n=2 Tax=Thalassospira TaxID=168934 RepID=A0A367W7D4_9PROT|nr:MULTISPECIES: LysR family transcriptional regulator [Thalassospira]MDG4720675.1 LysR family transcriptional regulator [Thalassospira sp. FZY0004]RCK37358.1 transcriptional regulator [Thalassospira profundimaris]